MHRNPTVQRAPARYTPANSILDRMPHSMSSRRSLHQKPQDIRQSKLYVLFDDILYLEVTTRPVKRYITWPEQAHRIGHTSRAGVHRTGTRSIRGKPISSFIQNPIQRTSCEELGNGRLFGQTRHQGQAVRHRFIQPLWFNTKNGLNQTTVARSTRTALEGRDSNNQ